MGLRTRIDRITLEITVFFSGALIMIFEIVGTRILSPYVGTSTYTWTSLIGVILAALSVGYWLGGSWADKQPKAGVLSIVLFGAGGLVGLTVLFKEPILIIVSQNSLPLGVKTILASLMLFAPASILLGFVPPYAVKLKTKTLETAGKTVGRLYALSTVGSILGTFAAGFFLIPFFGSARTLYLIAGVLFVLAAALAPLPISRAVTGTLVIFATGVVVNETQSYLMNSEFSFYDFDTEYSRIQIVETKHEKTGRMIRAMAIDPYIYQSSMFLDTREPATEYHKFYHLIRYFKPDFQRALMVGGAGYSFPKEFLRSYPGREIDVVEIDPAVTRLAKRFFDLKDSPRLKIVHQDGRVFLNEAPDSDYDVLLLDAFSSMFSIPFQLTTSEAIMEMHRVLGPEGIVILNIGTAIEGEAGLLLQAEAATYRSIFEEVHLFKVDPKKSGSRVQNIILVAIKKRIKYKYVQEDADLREMLSHKYDQDLRVDMPILTDDLAPVEYYSSFIQAMFVSQRD